MKDKVLQAQITEFVEKIAKSLRFYSKEPIFCKITIVTRTDHDYREPENDCDYYHITVTYALDVDRADIPIYERKADIEYVIDDKARELIRRVTVIKEEGEEDE